MEQNHTALDIREILLLLKKNIIILILLPLLAALLMFVYTRYFVTPQYEASMTLIVHTRGGEEQNVRNDLRDAQEIVNTYSIVLTRRPLLDEIIRELNLNATAESLRGRISAAPIRDTPIMRLTVTDSSPYRAQRILEEIAQRAEPVLVELVEVGSVGIVDYPEANHNPVSPNVMANVLLGIAGGLFVVLAFIFVKKALSNKFLTAEDIEQHLNIPLLGVIPQLNKYSSKKQRMRRNLAEIDYNKASFQYKEAIISLRTNLKFVTNKSGCKVILVTSALADEGKTSLSINLAKSLADIGKKVLLIDCDLRRPSIHQYLKIPNNANVGIVNFLEGDDSAEYIKLHKPNNNLDVLTSGRIPANPTEILDYPAMGELISDAAQTYDYVIMDSTPLAIVTDATVTSKYADGVVLVVRQNKATINQVQLVEQRLMNANADVLGVILNDFHSRHADKYSGYDSSYGYDSTQK